MCAPSLLCCSSSRGGLNIIFFCIQILIKQIMNLFLYLTCRSSGDQVVTNTLGIKESVKGKWWRPEDLGIVDYSQQSLNNSSGVIEALLSSGSGGASGGGGQKPGARVASVGGGAKSLYNDEDVLVMTDDIVPLVPGLLDGLKGDQLGGARSRSSSPMPRRGGARDSTEGILFHLHVGVSCAFFLLNLLCHCSSNLL